MTYYVCVLEVKFKITELICTMCVHVVMFLPKSNALMHIVLFLKCCYIIVNKTFDATFISSPRFIGGNMQTLEAVDDFDFEDSTYD